MFRLHEGFPLLVLRGVGLILYSRAGHFRLNGAGDLRWLGGLSLVGAYDWVFSARRKPVLEQEVQVQLRCFGLHLEQVLHLLFRRQAIEDPGVHESLK